MRRPLRALAIGVTLACVVSLVSVVAPVVEGDAPAAEAAVGSAFDPGRIVSDENFYDGDAMSTGQVQAFLDAQRPSCTAGYTCLPGYRQNTPAMAANAYCQAIGGASNESAASIIARIGAACNISQRFLLVLLQKEQSLVTSSAPVQRQYDRATGFACPDTAPCDASYGGFFYQVYYAARQFNVYKRFPTSYNHQPAAWNNVLFHPNSACGSSRVYIQNSATAGLYNYTPYQPNGAALANLYGTGDGCSSYGNRNTWRMWTDWFGDPSGVGTLLQAQGVDGIWFSTGGSRHRISDFTLFGELQAVYGNVSVVAPSVLTAIPEGAGFRRIVRTTDGTVSLFDNGWLHPFVSCAQVVSYGRSCDDIVNLTGPQSERLTLGDIMRPVARATTGQAFLVNGVGERREVSDVSVLPTYGIPTTSVVLGMAAIAHLRVGVPVVTSGSVLYNAARTDVRIVVGGATYGVWGSVFRTPLVSARGQLFLDESLRQLAIARPLPSRFSDGGQSYLVGESGIIAVDAAQHGGAQLFPAFPGGASLPSAGAISVAYMVRDITDPQVFLVSGGRLQPLTAQQVRDVPRQYGVSPTVQVVWPSALVDMPVTSSFPSGTLVGRNGEIHLIDGGQALRLLSWLTAPQLGLSIPATEVSTGVLAGLDRRGSLASPAVICRGLPRLGVNGQLVAFASDAVAHYPMTPTPLSDATCDRLTLTGQWLSRLYNAPNGTVYFMENGVRRPVPDIRTLQSLPGWQIPRITIPDSTLASIPVGPAVPRVP